MCNYSQVVDPMSEEGQALQRKKEFKSSINAWGSDASVHIIYLYLATKDPRPHDEGTHHLVGSHAV